MLRPALPQIRPAVPNQGVGHAILKAQYSSDDDLVVTTVVAVLCTALEASSRILNDRRPVQPIVAFETIKLADSFRGEALGKMLLLLGQDIHREVLGVDKRVIAVRVVRDAPKDQRWIQRNGIEAADRYANPPVVFINRRNDSHSRREAAQCSTKIGLVYLWFIFLVQAGFLVTCFCGKRLTAVDVAEQCSQEPAGNQMPNAPHGGNGGCSAESF